MSMLNGTESIDMDPMPSLTHSDVTSGSVMDLESAPLEGHQARVQAYGIQLQNDQLQRPHQQHYPNVQQQQQQQQQQQGWQQGHERVLQGYHPQQHYHLQPYQGYTWQTEKQQENYQYHPQQHQQRQAWPGDVANNQTLPIGGGETEMPSLTYSSNERSSLQSVSPHPRPGQALFGFPYQGVAGAGQGAGIAVEGSEEDQEGFFISVINMIPPGMSSGGTAAVPHYDYNMEFPHRQMLGRGGNGLIRRAYWALNKCDVVLKNLQETNMTAAKAILLASLFDKEVEVMKICGNHDNIVQFYGIATRNHPEKVERFMIMQYYEAGDLVNLIEKPQNLPEPPSLNDKLFLALDIALGLEHLFQCGFHHGDLHPKNILVDTRKPLNLNRGRYQARLTDFGLRRIRGNPGAVSSQPLGGVWRFMAPERLIKDRPRFNIQCDIFALGVIYWVLMSGRYPFKNTLTYSPGDREERIEGTPDWYYAVYSQAWQEDPWQRQQSFEEIIQVFQHQLGLPSTAAPSSLHMNSSQERLHYTTPSSGYHNPSSYSVGTHDRSHPQYAYQSGMGSVASPLYNEPYGSTETYSHPPPQPTASTASKSKNPSHPRNKKSSVPNGMPGRIGR
ncbi:hypothetical protein BGZ65_004093 [Modicella reniformis]|uniref:Protein kinase domain-containing protein n=1 Tax=Modicella reniformis TaxID=1440133 RepID=A0A9P6MBJ1_9FUNG|nr:hypothetical protein BGZ65_004093 [Modicella reniformis]